MPIPKGDKSHRLEVCSLHAIRLKILGNHLICKVTDKYLNVRGQMEEVESSKDGLLPGRTIL